MMKRLMMIAATLVAAGAASAQTNDLMISEYVEGSGYNKAIEIFNGTEDTINLAGYALERFSNGGTTAAVIALDAVDLLSGEAWVLTNTSFVDLEVADQTSADLNFNGDDALVLTFNGQPIDSFGRVGEDPGSFWSCDGGTTQNHTLRRLSGVCAGDTITDDAFDPCNQWNFFAEDLISGLGFHISDCGVVDTDGTTWSGLKASFR